MVNEFAIMAPRCGKADPRPDYILEIHYLYFAILLAGISAIIVASISLLTPPIERHYIYRLTWWSRFSTAKRTDIEKESKNRKLQRHKLDPEKFDDPFAPEVVDEGD